MTDNRHEEEEREPKFKIVDKRRIDLDDLDEPEDSHAEEAEPEVTAEAEAPADEKTEQDAAPGGHGYETAPGADKDRQDQQPEADPLSFANIHLSILQTLMSVAWVHMGLAPHPQTQLITKKTDEAKKAIDLFEAVLEYGRADMPDTVQIELDRALQDLKANYVSNL